MKQNFVFYVLLLYTAVLNSRVGAHIMLIKNHKIVLLCMSNIIGINNFEIIQINLNEKHTKYFV